MSYAQRYLLKLIFNIAVGDDDDGNTGANLRDQSPAASASIAAINTCKTLAQLKRWKAKNADGLNGLSPQEADTIIQLYSRRAEALRGAAP